MTRPFVSLHCHSEYSLLDGLSKVKELVKRAKELNHPAIALTDHGVMHGSIELYRNGLDEDIKPIIGCEAYLRDFAITSRLKDFSGDGDYKVKDRYHQLVLAQNPTGYKNLCKLTSIAHLGEGRGAKTSTAETSTKHKGWITLEELEQYSEGLIITSGCMAGIIPQCLKAGNPELADQIVEWYKKVFGDRFYIEIQDHAANDGSRELNLQLVALAQKHQVAIVATADNHYTKPCDKSAHDALLCINTKKLLSDEKRMRYEGAYWLPTGDEMLERLSAYLPYEIALEAIENTVKLAKQVEDYKLFRKPTPPRFSLPEGYDTPEFYVEELAYKGLRNRFKGSLPPQEYLERIDYELSIVNQMGFAEYFAIVEDLCSFARSKNIWLGIGRGSVGGSLVAYAMGITNIDPIPHGLLFERFLNPERRSMPDIDTDVCQERRGELIAYLSEKYGLKYVAQIATFGEMKSSSALKNTARVYNAQYQQFNEITKGIPKVRGKVPTLEKLISDRDTYAEFYDLYSNDKLLLDEEGQKTVSFKAVVDTAISLSGTVCSVGIHAAGVVIGWCPLDEVMPLMKGSEGEIVSQYQMQDVEDLGLIKFDVLGLKTLTVMRKAIEAIERVEQEVINLDEINYNDSRVFRFLGSGKTDGIFQFEGYGGDILRGIQPKNLNDVSAANTLNRPQCTDKEIDIAYIKRSQGIEPISYLIPALEPILKETLGLPINQEQLLRICCDIAGFSLGEADNIRRGIGKKDLTKIAALEQQFLEGCARNWHDEAVAKELFSVIRAGSEYGFNKSHSMAYGIIAYQTAWLKYYYYAYFMAALISLEKVTKKKKHEDDTNKRTQYIINAKKEGVVFLPPHINESDRDFLVLDSLTIRWGLTAITGVGDTLIDAIVLERQYNGAFKDWNDFNKRVKTNKKSLTALVKSGALDCLGLNRRQMLEYKPIMTAYKKAKEDRAKELLKWQKEADKITSEPSTSKKKKKNSQDAIQDTLKELDLILEKISEFKEPLPVPSIESIKDFSLSEKLKGEKEVLGLYASGHPLDSYKVGCNPFNEVVKNKLFISTVLITSVRETNSKNGTMAYCTIEDKEGATMTLKVFNEKWILYKSILRVDSILSITAKAQIWEKRLELILEAALIPTKNTEEEDEF